MTLALKIRELRNTATSISDDDFVVIDGATTGTRKMLASNINKSNFESIDSKFDTSFNNQLECGGISVTIKNTTTDSEMLDLFTKIKSICDHLILIMMIVPTDYTSSSFESVGTATMSKITNTVNSLGLTIDAVKVHLVTDWDDGNSSKAQITPAPGTEQTWFDNYQIPIMKYAKFCSDNNIKRLILCNENILLTNNLDLVPYWETLINTIKDSYSNLLLSISMQGHERKQCLIRKTNGVKNIMDLLDFISINTYPSLTDYDPDYNVEESDNLMRRHRSVRETVKDIKDLTILYGKDVIITELGNSGSTFGLKYPTKTGSSYVKDEEMRNKYYRLLLPVLASIPGVKGLFIWRINDIFSPYGETGANYLKEFFSGKNDMTVINDAYTYDLESTEKSEYISNACADTVSPWLRVGYITLDKLNKLGKGTLRIDMDVKSMPHLGNIDGHISYFIGANGDGTFETSLTVISNNEKDLSSFIKFGIEETNTKSTLYIKNNELGDIVTVSNIDAFCGESDYMKRDNETFILFKPIQLRSWMFSDFVNASSAKYLPELKHYQMGNVTEVKTLTAGENVISFGISKSLGITTSQKVAKTGFYDISGIIYIRSLETIITAKVLNTVFALGDGTIMLNLNGMMMCSNTASCGLPFHIKKKMNAGDTFNVKIIVPSNAGVTYRVTTESNVLVKEI